MKSSFFVISAIAGAAVSQMSSAEWMHYHWSGTMITEQDWQVYSTGRFDLYLETETFELDSGGTYFYVNLCYGAVSVDTPAGEVVYASGGVRNCQVQQPYIANGNFGGDSYWYFGDLKWGDGPVDYLGWYLESPPGAVWTDKSIAAFLERLATSGTRMYALPDANLPIAFISSGDPTITQEVPAAITCYADLNLDGMVDDQDFVLFVVAYDKLLCSENWPPTTCAADFNRDFWVDDSDFVPFVIQYNELLCP